MKKKSLDVEEKTKLLVRADDFGVCHGINMATAKGLSEGVVTCAGLIVPAPWFPEAAQICREHPEFDVGVEAALTSEWKEMRWRPVSPWGEVRSLVDESGFFHPTTREFLAANPRLEEVEKEVRAQMDLAIRMGVRVSYLAHHMGALRQTPELLDLTAKLAQEYGVVNSRLSGEHHLAAEKGVGPYAEEVTQGWMSAIADAAPGVNLLITHLGMDTPEMRALHAVHNNQSPAQSRSASMAAATDPCVRRVIEERGIELIGYRQLLEDESGSGLS